MRITYFFELLFINLFMVVFLFDLVCKSEKSRTGRNLPSYTRRMTLQFLQRANITFWCSSATSLYFLVKNFQKEFVNFNLVGLLKMSYHLLWNQLQIAVAIDGCQQYYLTYYTYIDREYRAHERIIDTRCDAFARVFASNIIEMAVIKLLSKILNWEFCISCHQNGIYGCGPVYCS